MNKRAGFGSLILVAFALFYLLPSAYAAGCGVIPSSLTGLITGCYPANIVNTQGSPTLTGFQQEFTNVPFNANSPSGNWLVVNSLSGGIIPCWAQNSTAVWCNLGANTIAASSSANGIYVFDMGSASTKFFGAANDVGAYTCNSMSYDSGNLVFGVYDDFCGTSLKAQWNVGAGATAAVSNGLTYIVNGASNPSGGWTTTGMWTTGSVTLPAKLITYLSQPANSGCAGISDQNSADSTASGYVSIFGAAAAGGWSQGSPPATQVSFQYFWTASTYYMPSIYITSTTATFSMNGNTAAMTGLTNSAAHDAFMGDQACGSKSASTLNVAWTLVSVPPPANIMPTTSYGGFQAVLSLSISLTPNPITYGQTSTITASCSGAGSSYCYLGFITPGNIIAQGSSTATYTTTAYAWPAGSYTFYAYNIITTNTIGTLTINDATVPMSCTQNTATTPNGVTYTTLNAVSNIACTFTTYNSQLTGSIYFNNAKVASGLSPTYSAAWNNANTPVVANEIGDANYTSNSLTFYINSIPYSVISSTALATAYETSNQSIQYVVNVTKAATSATMSLYTNSMLELSQTQNILPGPNTWNFYQNIPLLTANGIIYTYNGAITVNTLSYGLITANPVNTLLQTEYENYFLTTNAFTPYGNSIGATALSILGDNITVNTIITQAIPLNNAAVAGSLQIGNKNLGEIITSAYHYSGTATSFTPALYGLANPTTGSPVTITANSIVKLSFLGSNVYRNTSITFKSYNETLASCSVYPTNTVNFAFYNASSPTQAWPLNVLLQGFFNVTNNNYVSNTIPGINVGFNALANSNAYSTCIYPSWAKFEINAATSYHSGQAASIANTSAFYFQNFAVSNTPWTQRLYINSEYNPLDYQIIVENSSTLNPVTSLIKIGLYNLGTGTSTPISELLAAGGLTGHTYLDIGTTYTFQVYTPNGAHFITAPQPFKVISCSSSYCQYPIYVGNSITPNPAGNLTDMSASCTPTPLAGNTESVSCNVNSKSGASYSYNLSIYLQGAVGQIIACGQNATVSSGSLSCTVGSTRSTFYNWILNVYVKNLGWVQVPTTNRSFTAGTFGTHTSSIPDGSYIAVIILIALCLLSIQAKNMAPILVLIALNAGVFISSTVGLIFVNTPTLGFMLLLTALTAYLVLRRGPGG